MQRPRATSSTRPGAQLVGIGVAVEKGFQHGGDKLRGRRATPSTPWPSSTARLTGDHIIFREDDPEMKKVLVLDFGGQYNLLVARRVRECGVYCEIKSFRIDHGARSAPLRPTPSSSPAAPPRCLSPNAPMVDPAMLSTGRSRAGHLLRSAADDAPAGRRSAARPTPGNTARRELTHTGDHPLFDGVPEDGHVLDEPRRGGGAPGPRLPRSSPPPRAAATRRCSALEKKLYGVQFHPEVMHTEYGKPDSGELPVWHLRLPRRVDHGVLYGGGRGGVPRDRSAMAGCCWPCPAAWTAPWPPRCCSGPWATS